MARLFSIRPGITWRGRQFRGIRGWAGKPLHAPLTDFPVTSYVLVAIFDVISYVAGLQGYAVTARDAFVAGTYVIIAGAIVSLATVTTGFWDWWKGIDRDSSTGPIGRASHTQVWRTINWHAVVMLVVTAIVIVDIIFRLGSFDSPSAGIGITVLSVLAGILVSYGAFYGGELVYDFQFNVEGLKGSKVWEETEQDEFPRDRQ